MPWTAPRTWTTGELVTGAEMNQQVRDNELFLAQFIGFRVYRSAALSHTSSGNFVTLDFDTATLNADGAGGTCFSLATDTFTCPLTGDWLVGYQVRTAQFGGSNVLQAQVVDQATVNHMHDDWDSGVNIHVGAKTQSCDILALTAGNTLVLKASQNSGGSVAYDVGIDRTFFFAYFLGT